MQRDVLIAGTLLCVAFPARAADVDFDRDVKPILRDNCWACHGPTQQMATLRLDQREAAMIAGRGKIAIMPGRSDRRLVYRPAAGRARPQLPPTARLTRAQLATNTDSLGTGATWPAD